MAFVFSLSGELALADPVVVTPADMQGWEFQLVGVPLTASAQMVSGPGTPPLGVGSAEFLVGANGDGAAQLRHPGFSGTVLSDLTAFSYSTYVSSFMGCQAIYIILNLDVDGDEIIDDLLFFEPCYQTGAYSGDLVPNQGAPVLNTWQTWNALAGGWWSLNAGNFGPPLTTLASYIGATPGATIVNAAGGLGGVRLVAGFGAGAWDEFAGNVDAFTIGVDGVETTYNFEPAVLLVDQDGSATEADCNATGPAFTTIQAAVNAASAGQTIGVCPGTYIEQVTIGSSLSGLSLQSVTPLAAVIHAPSPMADPKAVVRVSGATGVTIDGFTITGPGDGSCDSIRYGIRIDGGGSAVIENNHITAIRDVPFSGCQNGLGILVGRQAESTTGSAVIQNNVVEAYQKGGIVVDNAGSSATITANNLIGVGQTGVIAQNGIQVSRGATGNIVGNMVSFNGPYTQGAAKGFVSTGILIFESPGFNAGQLQSENVLFRNQVAVFVITP